MHFDNQAQNWDNDPMKVERAAIIAQEIKSFIPSAPNLRGLEFGCGTGLLSFQLKDLFQSITLTDTSEGMISVLKDKIAKNKLTNFNPVLIDLAESKATIEKQDVIYTLMTLHHIQNIAQITKVFNSILETGGFLCIADLVSEDGSFHAHLNDFDGHNGFDEAALSQILSDTGFEICFYKICFEIEKSINDTVKKYPIFLLIGRKR